MSTVLNNYSFSIGITSTIYLERSDRNLTSSDKDTSTATSVVAMNKEMGKLEIKSLEIYLNWSS